MTPDQIKIVDSETVDFPSIVEAARLHLHRELGCDVQDGCFAAGDLHGLACKVFAKTLYGTKVVDPLLELAALPILGVFSAGPNAKDLPHVRQGCLLVYWYAAFYLSCDRSISFGYGLDLVAGWMHERFAQGTPEEYTWVFHPCRRGPAPAPRTAAT